MEKLNTGNILIGRSLNKARKIITAIKSGKRKGQLLKTDEFSKWELIEKNTEEIIVKSRLWYGFCGEGFIYNSKHKRFKGEKPVTIYSEVFGI